MSHEDDRTIALMAATIAGGMLSGYLAGSHGSRAIDHGNVAAIAVHLARAIAADAETAERETEKDDHAR